MSMESMESMESMGNRITRTFRLSEQTRSYMQALTEALTEAEAEAEADPETAKMVRRWEWAETVSQTDGDDRKRYGDD